MKKITVFAAGSRGDIQPCITLSKGLQQAGYQVCLAAPQDFGDFIRAYDVDFYPLGGDVQQIMASDTGRKFMESEGGNPLKSIRAMRTLLAPVVNKMTEDAYAACRETQGLICLGVLSAFGRSISEALHIPMLQIEPTPLLSTRAFAAPSWPIQRNLGGLHNSLSGWVMMQVIWQWYRPFVEDFRQNLGLPAYKSANFYRTLRSTPMLGAYSPSIISHPPDWPETVHITGYLFLEPQGDWQPPTELQTFLDAGDPPVYIGFGSMSGRHPEKLAKLMLQALEQSGQRGVLTTGWGGLRTEAAAKNVYILDSAPHSWLFPHMAAVVHHGGAGTTAEGLRAGVPSIILPFAFDQSFWGARIKALGLGPAPIPQKQLTADRLANAISKAVNDAEMKRRASVIGEAIRAENGTGSAVKTVQDFFGKPV